MSAPVPGMYLRIATELRHRISSGTWPAGTRLPNREALADLTGFPGSVNAVRKALELLMRDGLLIARAGSGTFVADTPRIGLRGDATAATGFSATGLGKVWTAASTRARALPDDVAERLGVAPDSGGVRTEYEVRAAPGGRLLYFGTTWEPEHVTGGSPVLMPDSGPLAGSGVVERMRSIGIRIVATRWTLRPGELTADQARRLGTARASAMVACRTHINAEGRAVETSRWILPAATTELHVDVPLPRQAASVVSSR
ncbi:GntR family transcriptional regulator [Streptomyces rubiginosohelvolus]|uniref:GntR family transcriptional regulator n=1 Tax=Streptomyces rubiginosohelvolus TaxID=67362 RepID=UPI0036A38AC1